MFEIDDFTKLLKENPEPADRGEKLITIVTNRSPEKEARHFPYETIFIDADGHRHPGDDTTIDLIKRAAVYGGFGTFPELSGTGTFKDIAANLQHLGKFYKDEIVRAILNNKLEAHFLLNSLGGMKDVKRLNYGWAINTLQQRGGITASYVGSQAAENVRSIFFQTEKKYVLKNSWFSGENVGEDNDEALQNLKEALAKSGLEKTMEVDAAAYEIQTTGDDLYHNGIATQVYDNIDGLLEAFSAVSGLQVDLQNLKDPIARFFVCIDIERQIKTDLGQDVSLYYAPKEGKFHIDPRLPVRKDWKNPITNLVNDIMVQKKYRT